MLSSDLNFNIRLSPTAAPEYAQRICERLGKSVIEVLIKHDAVTPIVLTIINEELKLVFESLSAMKKVCM